MQLGWNAGYKYEQLDKAKNVKILADVNAVPPAGLEGVGLKDDNSEHPCGGVSIGPLTSGDIKVKTQYKMFEKMCATDTPLYLNFDEALKDLKRNIEALKKIIILSSYCEDLRKIFYKKNFKIFIICVYNSLNLKDYCKKVVLTKNLNSKNLLSILKKIDPFNEMSILLGSGFAETISEDIISGRKNYGNNFETIKKTKSKKFFEELQKQKLIFQEYHNNQKKWQMVN